jgi:hypothetical protein
VAVDVGQYRRSPAGGEGELHRRRLSLRFGVGRVEVSVAVDEQQAVAATFTQGQQAAEEDRAVAAEHHRELCLVQQWVERPG